MSVRSFRVGAVSFTGLEGSDGVQAVTIQTAMEVAMEEHSKQNVDQVRGGGGEGGGGAVGGRTVGGAGGGRRVG